MTEQNTQTTIKDPAQSSLDAIRHNRGADLLKFFLLPFVCFWAFGLPDGVKLVSTLSGFAIPAFFILSGYFVLAGNGHMRRIKLKRAIQRALVTFGLMALCYFLLCYFLFDLVQPGESQESLLLRVLNRQALFDFLALNVWPFSLGGNIWFIQALLYAYVILLIVNQFGGLKYYKIILALSMVFMVLTGELAGVIGLRVFDRAYLPDGALNRALPYVLLGMLLREKTEKLKTVKSWVYILVFVLGAALAVGEIYLLDSLGKLVYQGHMIGFGVMAAAACGWAVSRPQMKRTFFSNRGRKYAKRVYALGNPVFYAVLPLVGQALPWFKEIAAQFGGIIVYAVCLLLCVAITQVKKWAFKLFS